MPVYAATSRPSLDFGVAWAHCRTCFPFLFPYPVSSESERQKLIAPPHSIRLSCSTLYPGPGLWGTLVHSPTDTSLVSTMEGKLVPPTDKWGAKAPWGGWGTPREPESGLALAEGQWASLQTTGATGVV